MSAQIDIDQVPTKVFCWRTSNLARWLLVLALSFLLLFITATMVVVPFVEPAVGALIVTTIPAGAQILLDDRVIAQSPAKLEDVPAGSHNIKVIKSGFNAIEYNLSINKKQTFTLPVISLLPYRHEMDETKGSPPERIQEFGQLAQAAYERGDYVSPIYHNALYFTNAILAIDVSPYVGE